MLREPGCFIHVLQLQGTHRARKWDRSEPEISLASIVRRMGALCTSRSAARKKSFRYGNAECDAIALMGISSTASLPLMLFQLFRPSL